VYPPEGRTEKAAEFGRYLVVRNEQAKVIRQCNQMPVEQPVGRRRESQTVLDNVRTAIRDRHDVCRLSLCASASVNNAQAGDGTGVIVCIHDGTPKRRISDSTIDQELLDPSFLFRDGRSQQSLGIEIGMRIVEFEPKGVVRSQGFLQTGSHDGAELSVGNDPH
jgi:hypothetical protein